MERLRHLEGVIVRLQADLAGRSSILLAENKEVSGGKVRDTGEDCTGSETMNREENGLEGVTKLETELGRLAIRDGRSRYVVSSFWASLDEEVCIVPCQVLHIGF
jgi:hypothetical protein